ncbi:MAG TPA: hypothetical protein VKQ72_01335, partial [Aggregatilineales bacterium]|nr:hypothetical protein [Aggregatilineales bacterium]
MLALLAMMLISETLSGQAASAATSLTAKVQPAYNLVYEAHDGELHDQQHIYVANFDGSNPRMVSGPAVAFATEPLWSPDGKRIVFLAGAVDGHWAIPTQVYVVNADGSLLHLIQRDPKGIGYSPGALSPDGLHLLTGLNSGERDIVDLQGNVLFRKTDTLNQNSSGIYGESWSPDGKRLVIVSSQDLDIVDLKGNVVFHTSRSSDRNKNGTVVWSPDGLSIAYWTNSTLSLMNADGSNLHQLTNTDTSADDVIWPLWSPDSKQIAFMQGQKHSQQIYFINIDGSGKRPLVPDGTGNFGPAWSPDGSQIAYSDKVDVHVINADGTHDRPLHTRFGGGGAQWSPDGQYLLYQFLTNDQAHFNPAFAAHLINTDGTNDHVVADWSINASWQPASPTLVGGADEVPPTTSTTTPTLPSTSTPVPTNALLLTALPTERADCGISAHDMITLGNTELIWNLHNEDASSKVTLIAITLDWGPVKRGIVWQSIGINEDSIWIGNQASPPATVRSPWMEVPTWLAVPDLGPGSGMSVVVNFTKLDLTPGQTYTATATFDNGCS